MHCRQSSQQRSPLYPWLSWDLSRVSVWLASALHFRLIEFDHEICFRLVSIVVLDGYMNGAISSGLWFSGILKFAVTCGRWKLLPVPLLMAPLCIHYVKKNHSYKRTRLPSPGSDKLFRARILLHPNSDCNIRLSL